MSKQRMILGGMLLALLVGVAQAAIQEREGRLTLENPLYAIQLATGEGAGVGWLSLANRSVAPGEAPEFYKQDSPGRMFELTLLHAGRKETLSSLDFKVVGRRIDSDECRLELVPRNQAIPLTVDLRIRTDATGQSRWDFSFKAPAATEVDFVFPLLEGLRLGRNTADIGYFFPREPGLMNNVPVRLATNYGQYAQCQLMAVYNDRWGAEGGGFYYFLMDTSLRRKGFELVKNDPRGPAPIEQLDNYGFPFWGGFKSDEGVGIATTWRRIPLNEGKAELPTVALGIHPGNWRQAFAAYRSWVATWYNHPQRTPAFQRVFAFHPYTLFDKPTPQAALDSIPKGVDQLHFMVQKEHVNGEYGYRNDWGLAGIQDFVKQVKGRGMLASHYLEGYIASPKSEVYLKHGAEWGQKLKDGSNAVAFSNMSMCLSVPEWTQFLVGETTRLERDLQLDVVYLDEVGFGTGEKYDCFNARHPHAAPYMELNNNRKMFETVRRAIRKEKPDVVLTTEGPVVDLWYPNLDGNEGYGVRSYQAEAYGPPIHFMRFLYPDFKFIDLRIGTEQELTRQMKQILFNGTAADMNPENEKTFDATAARIFRDHRAALTDPAPEPNLPTREPGLYCNRFKAGQKTLYTLWNDNKYPVAGAALPVPVSQADRDSREAHYVDLIRQREVKLARIGQGAHAVVELAPEDVSVIARLPRLIDWTITGSQLQLKPAQAGAQLAASLVDGQGAERKRVEIAPAQTSLNLAEVSERGRWRVVLKLYDKGELLDEAILPALGEIDLAPFAKATASNTDKAHGREPESVIRKTKNFSGYDQGVPIQSVFGNWEYLWDDQPRPGWIELSWAEPQTFDTVHLRFSQLEYAPADYELQISDDGTQWKTIGRSAARDFVTQDRFEPVSARKLRAVFHKGGAWGQHVQLQKFEVLLTGKP